MPLTTTTNNNDNNNNNNNNNNSQLENKKIKLAILGLNRQSSQRLKRIVDQSK
jgi:hypothetical protein